MLIGYFIKQPLDKLFLEKPHLFLIILNKKWERAWEEAKLIRNLLEKHGVKPGDHILDLGCGNGRIAINLAKMGYRVTGLDYSPIFLEDAIVKAKRHNVDGRVLFIYGDAVDVDEIFNEEVFDTVLIYWTSIIGYSIDPGMDELILSKLYRITRHDGYLMILNHAVLESMDYKLLSREPAILTDLGEYVIVEKPLYDPINSILHSKWIFYKRKNKDLIYLDEVSYSLRIYSTHEIIGLASKAGWKLENIYCDLKTLEPYTPGKCGLNIIFRKQYSQDSFE